MRRRHKLVTHEGHFLRHHIPGVYKLSDVHSTSTPPPFSPFPLHYRSFSLPASMSCMHADVFPLSASLSHSLASACGALGLILSWNWLNLSLSFFLGTGSSLNRRSHYWYSGKSPGVHEITSLCPCGVPNVLIFLAFDTYSYSHNWLPAFVSMAPTVINLHLLYVFHLIIFFS